MKHQVALVLTVANAAMLLYTLAQPYGTSARETPAVLRGRSLEIVDEQGRVRAEIKIHPADPNIRMPDGTKGYPEAAVLRLFTSRHNPNVKLSTTEDGAGLVIGSQSGYVQALSRGPEPLLKLVHTDGREQLVSLAKKK